MKYDSYSEFAIREDLSVFDFVSIGQRGKIPKRIAFIPTELPDVYNLALGDLMRDGDMDDKAVSNNGDRN